jgi:anti-sigma factor RsiW
MTMTCEELEARLAALVDGELDAAEAAEAARHLGGCVGCQAKADAEALGRDLMRDAAPHLTVAAPPRLRAVIRRTIPEAAPRRRWLWAGASAAAAVALVAGAIGVASVFRPVPLFAAQAALDHLKCVRIGPSAASPDARALEASWREWQGWDLHVPTGEAGAGLRLLGYRRCVLTEGKMAHVLYDRGGSVVSLFVMPAGVDRGATVAHAELEMFGQDAVLWTSYGHTYALVGRGGRGALTPVAAALERELTAGTPR